MIEKKSCTVIWSPEMTKDENNLVLQSMQELIPGLTEKQIEHFLNHLFYVKTLTIHFQTRNSTNPVVKTMDYASCGAFPTYTLTTEGSRMMHHSMPTRSDMLRVVCTTPTNNDDMSRRKVESKVFHEKIAFSLIVHNIAETAKTRGEQLDIRELPVEFAMLWYQYPELRDRPDSVATLHVHPLMHTLVRFMHTTTFWDMTLWEQVWKHASESHEFPEDWSDDTWSSPELVAATLNMLAGIDPAKPLLRIQTETWSAMSALARQTDDPLANTFRELIFCEKDPDAYEIMVLRFAKKLHEAEKIVSKINHNNAKNNVDKAQYVGFEELSELCNPAQHKYLDRIENPESVRFLATATAVPAGVHKMVEDIIDMVGTVIEDAPYVIVLNEIDAGFQLPPQELGGLLTETWVCPLFCGYFSVVAVHKEFQTLFNTVMLHIAITNMEQKFLRSLRPLAPLVAKLLIDFEKHLDSPTEYVRRIGTTGLHISARLMMSITGFSDMNHLSMRRNQFISHDIGQLIPRLFRMIPYYIVHRTGEDLNSMSETDVLTLSMRIVMDRIHMPNEGAPQTKALMAFLNVISIHPYQGRPYHLEIEEGEVRGITDMEFCPDHIRDVFEEMLRARPPTDDWNDSNRLKVSIVDAHETCAFIEVALLLFDRKEFNAAFRILDVFSNFKTKWNGFSNFEHKMARKVVSEHPYMFETGGNQVRPQNAVYDTYEKWLTAFLIAVEAGCAGRHCKTTICPLLSHVVKEPLRKLDQYVVVEGATDAIPFDRMLVYGFDHMYRGYDPTVSQVIGTFGKCLKDKDCLQKIE